MGNFTAILIEGIFYHDDEGTFMVQPYRGQKACVKDTLDALRGENVRIAIQHLPQMPLDPQSWGGGSCLHQQRGYCPFGHHKDPHSILNFVAEGGLLTPTELSSDWFVRSFDGIERRLPLGDLLGHHGRLAAATMFSVEDIKDKLAEAGMLDSVEGLGSQIGDLRGLLERLKGSQG